jgi:hypothetical protein
MILQVAGPEKLRPSLSKNPSLYSGIRLFEKFIQKSTGKPKVTAEYI